MMDAAVGVGAGVTAGWATGEGEGEGEGEGFWARTTQAVQEKTNAQKQRRVGRNIGGLRS